MKDAYGRHLLKLRISVLDACNLRCRYCMPENPSFTREPDLLSLDQLFKIAESIVKTTGVQSIRVTGGEPLLRTGLPRFVEKLRTLPVRQVGLTTNALLLKPQLGELLNAGLSNVNVSLDTLQEDHFWRISRRSGLHRVLEGIEAAVEARLPVKLNCVVQRSFNFSEVVDLLDYAFGLQVPIRFLEVMNIGVMQEHFEREFVPAEEILKKIGGFWDYTPEKTAVDSTARMYATSGGSFGIIASESMPFCGNCSRLRLTARGKIMGCLFREDYVTIPSLENNREFDASVKAAVREAFHSKPIQRKEFVAHPMHSMGG